MQACEPTPELVILRELLAQETGFVSGSALAEKLAMSRVAVWQHMEKLRSQGFEFEAIRARGYRIVHQPKNLNATLVEALLAETAHHCQLIVLDEVDSTNDEAARQLATGRKTPFVVLARRQTQGRGRFGRSWNSAHNNNMYASFGFRPALTPERLQAFTLWMGVNVCDFVAESSQTAPGIKWPNDLLLNGRKAGGMLTEARIDSDHVRDLVFGLALNVNAANDASPRATSIAEESRKPLDINRFTANLIRRMIASYEAFIDGRHRETFATLWDRFDTLRGQPIALIHGACRYAGTAEGIDDEGGLRLRDSAGQIQHFRAGEVTMEKDAATGTVED